MSKLQTLTEMEGYHDSMDMVEEAMFDGVAPGICKNPGCDYTTQVEPDSHDGWCECCEAGTVQSCLVLAGVM